MCRDQKKKKNPNERTDQSSRKKIKLSNEEIANLSDAQFKILVTRMLTEMVEYGHKIGEEVKTIQGEIKKTIQGTNRKGRKQGLKSMVWSIRKK